MTVRAIALVAVGLLAAACQSKEEGMKLLCAAPERAGLENILPEEKGRVLARWIEANVSNNSARVLIEKVGQAPLAQRGELLREASNSVGLKSCAWAEYWDELAAELEQIDAEH
jgi:hypothetical protein